MSKWSGKEVPDEAMKRGTVRVELQSSVSRGQDNLQRASGLKKDLVGSFILSG